MAFTVEASVEINQSPDKVFAAYTDIPTTPEWIGGVASIRDFSGQPVGVGTTYQHVTKLLGKEFTADNEVTVFLPGKQFVHHINSGLASGDMTVDFETVDNGTRVHMSFEGEMGGLFNLAAPLLKGNLQKQMTADLNNLKQLLEG